MSFRNLVFAFILLCLWATGAVPAVYFVDTDAAGSADGLSWANAFNHPQDALDIAAPGDEVWVAEGTYVRRSPVSKSVAQLAPGVSLYGGFGGTESLREQRDHTRNVTTLDGGGNVEHVVAGAVATRLDGFTVTGGAPYTSCCLSGGGGAYYNAGTAVVANTLFLRNISHQGGAVFARNTDLTVIDCTFSENRAEDLGGAIYSASGSLSVSRSTFSQNVAAAEGWGAGGGIYSLNSSFTVTNSGFNMNSAVHDGGAVYVEGGVPSLEDSRFVGNSANKGGAIYSTSVTGSIRNSLFENNSAPKGTQQICEDLPPPYCYQVSYGGYGGALNSDNTDMTVFANVFVRNGAERGGGAVYIDGSRLSIEGSTFAANSAGLNGGALHSQASFFSVVDSLFEDNDTTGPSGKGGALFVDGAGGPETPSVAGSVFRSNRSVYSGGAMAIATTKITIDSSRFLDNSAGVKGGAIENYIYTSLVPVPVITNSVFARNTAPDGAAINNSNRCPGIVMNLRVVNSTFTRNIADQDGGGIRNEDCASFTAENSIFWSNVAATSPQIAGIATVVYSDVQGGYPGAGNMDADPVLVDPLADDFHLSPLSPLIDRASLAVAPAVDFEGDPRPYDGDGTGGALPDIGADEYAGPVCAAVPDSDSDNIGDACDNCTLTANPRQRDTDRDGFGNACDADFNNDGRVDFSDLAYMKSVFFTGDAEADLNGDDRVDFADLGRLKATFFTSPGPSGLNP